MIIGILTATALLAVFWAGYEFGKQVQRDKKAK